MYIVWPELTLKNVKKKSSIQESLVKIFREEDLIAESFECDAIEKYRQRLNYNELKPLFSAVVREIVSSKQACASSIQKEAPASSIWKYDIILQAPCGSGKSCCFAVASQILGGITVRLI